MRIVMENTLDNSSMIFPTNIYQSVSPMTFFRMILWNIVEIF